MAQERLEEIRTERLRKREALLTEGQVPYPAEARRTHTAAEIQRDHATLAAEQTPLLVAGRVTARRGHGGLLFLDLTDATGKIQLQLAKDRVAADFFTRLASLDIGDFIQAAGTATLTQRGEPTLLVTEWHFLSKSVRPLPSSWFGIKDQETRFRQRELDFLLNPEPQRLLALRGSVIQWLRTYLTNSGFHEVTTPILQPLAGGAAATPFMTHHKALGIPLYLRIAPELYLKRLMVGGYEKVFELGPNFRNEGIDREHNPEFTMLEFYWAYADYEDLMDLTERFLSDLIREITGGEETTWGETTLTWSQPWRRVRYGELLQQALGIDVFVEKDPATYLALFTEKGLTPPAVTTYAKLVDELYKELVRPTLVQPTIVYDYPLELAPLAKARIATAGVAEKFQLVVGGMELINAYTELNDPVEQRKRFVAQQVERQQGDTEAPELDEEYLRVMEYGMPPMAGCGLGVDRLVTLLGNAPNLRETIAFPLLRPQNI